MRCASVRIFLVFPVILGGVSLAQSDGNPVEAWVSRYNGPGNGQDQAAAIALDETGNVYVTGFSKDGFTNNDIATIKYTPQGVEEWVVRHNGLGNGDDAGVDIALDGSGNVFLAGYDYGSESWDCSTIAYDDTGDTQWYSNYDGQFTDRASAIVRDSSGNICITGLSYGSSYSNMITIKYNSVGIQQWVVFLPSRSSFDSGGNAIAVDFAGNVYVTGYIPGGNSFPDYVTIKYDANGEEQWIATYNGPGNYEDVAEAIAVDESGNVYITGYSDGGSTGYDYATIKYNSDGEEQWIARYNGPDNMGDWANSIDLDGTGNVYVTGQGGGGIYSNMVTIKYNSDGEYQWIAVFNGPENNTDVACAMSVDETGSVYVAGNSSNGSSTDIVTIKYSPDGEQQWAISYNGPGNDDDRASDMALDSLGNIFLTGRSTGIESDYDYVTIKYTQSTGIEQENEFVPAFGLHIYPNPASEIVSISVTHPELSDCSVAVYSLDGRLVENLNDKQVLSGESTFSWDAGRFPVGVYLVRASAESQAETSLVVVTR